MAWRDLFKRGRGGPSGSVASKPSPPRAVVAPPRPAPAPTSGAVGRWVPAGEAITVGGQQIPGGMVYVGQRLPAAHGGGTDPALIDPTQSVDWRNPDWTGGGLHYWPSYHDIPAASRAAYLSWLADGRRHPTIPIGYVFLFFYGLERRAIVDLKLDPVDPEITQIGNEVDRLLDLYGSNRSFNGYATGLLSLLAAAQALKAPVTPSEIGPLGDRWEVPPVVRIAVGRYVAAGQPIPPAWALTFLRTHPEGYLRTPATRCTAEFDDLFQRRYQARYGAGMTIRPPKAVVSFSYQPASAGFRRRIDISLGSLPDISRLSAPITKLRDVGAECTDALDAYSRLIGRNPEAVGTAAAVALLPEELLATHGGPAVDGLRSWASAAIAGGPVVVGLDDAVARWSPGRTTKLNKADAVGLAGLLGKFGVGIEPDVRFGASTPAPGSQVVLFDLPAGAPAAPSPPYKAAATLVHLTAVVAAADGSVSAEERAHVARHIEGVLGLEPAERARLDAHLQWLVAGRPALAGLKKRLDALNHAQRSAIGGFLIDIAAADGRVTPDEIATLTKVYRLLGLDEAEVYRLVHALGTGDAGPPVVRAAEAERRWAVPAEPPAPDVDPTGPEPVAAVVLDPARVQARLAETATVSALLADIFTDDEDGSPLVPAPVPVMASNAGGPTVAGLDGAHSALAVALRARPSWERPDVEALASELGLPLLDGALDRINEAALDRTGEPLVEGDDTLELNSYAVEELFA